jgi:hypothetical protein
MGVNQVNLLPVKDAEEWRLKRRDARFRMIDRQLLLDTGTKAT